MSLIKFPTHIKPSRVTVQLRRVDETISSPLSNIQQVISRGNPAWQFTYEFNDLSLEEREVVHSFLMSCRGSLNTFKVHDPASYQIRGSLSYWIDVYSDYGSFNTIAGSDDTSINSWFSHDAEFATHITDEKTVRIENRNHIYSYALMWKAHGGGGWVNSLEQGYAYLLRAKYFVGTCGRTKLRAGTASGTSNFGENVSLVQSSGVMSMPVVSPTTSMNVSAGMYSTSSMYIGDHQGDYADYQLIPCAIVANSENLLLYSKNFSNANWTKTNVTVTSGYSERSPSGVQSGSWKLATVARTNTEYMLRQIISKSMSEDIYTASVKVKGDEFNRFRLELYDNASSYAYVDVWTANVLANPPLQGGTFKGAIGRAFDIGSGWVRANITAIVSSLSDLRARISIRNLSGQTQFTSAGGEGFLIDDFQLRQGPFAGNTVITSDTAIVGSTTPQTGNKMLIEGLPPSAQIKAGQRFEVINQYHDDDSDLYERSEFKRITRECVVHREGWAEIEFDPPIRNAPVTQRNRGSVSPPMNLHGAVIFHRPEMKARLLNGTIQYIDKPLQMTDVVFDVLEDLTE